MLETDDLNLMTKQASLYFWITCDQFSPC